MIQNTIKENDKIPVIISLHCRVLIDPFLSFGPFSSLMYVESTFDVNQTTLARFVSCFAKSLFSQRRSTTEDAGIGY